MECCQNQVANNIYHNRSARAEEVVHKKLRNFIMNGLLHVVTMKGRAIDLTLASISSFLRYKHLYVGVFYTTQLHKVSYNTNRIQGMNAHLLPSLILAL